MVKKKGKKIGIEKLKIYLYFIPLVCALIAFCLLYLLKVPHDTYHFLILGLLSMVLFLNSAISLVINQKSFTSDSIAMNSIQSFWPFVFLLLSIWTLRFNVGIHTTIQTIELDDNQIHALNKFEHFLNAMVHALQSFSMDEDYTEYILHGKQYVLNHFPAGFAWIADFYGGYAAFLNILAPIAGGAILFDILTNIFPVLNLRLMLLFKRNTKSHVFSELNLRSITLAESIHQKRPGEILVFTDVYIQYSEEKPSELELRAKKLGAICLKSDLSILKRLSWGPVHYYLMDESDTDNVESLASLTKYEKKEDEFSFFDIWRKKNSFVKIYVFSDSPLVEQMIENFNANCKSEGLNLIAAKPIQENEILSFNLVRSFPLYNTFFKNEMDVNKNTVSILLLGSSPLICNYIKTTYWCGQMLNPKNPTIHLTPEYHILTPDVDKIEEYIASSMPVVNQERVLSKCGTNTCEQICYATWDIQGSELNKVSVSEIIEQLEHVDICLIDTEDDLENIKLGDALRSILDSNYLKTNHKTDILCVIKNPILKDSCQIFASNNHAPNPVYYVCGTDEMMDIDLIQSTEMDRAASQLQDSYNTTGDNKKWNGFISFTPGKENEADPFNPIDYQNNFSNLYDYISNTACAIHYPYKLFSAGILEKDNRYEEKEYDYLKNFVEKLLGIDLESEGVKDVQPDNTCINNLYWLEKIRWNAFVKAYGYDAPSPSQLFNYYVENFKFKKEYKEQYKDTKVFRKKFRPFNPHKPSKFFDGHKILLHVCLVEVPKPTGMPLGKMSVKDRKALQQACMKDFFTKKFTNEQGIDYSWEQFLCSMSMHQSDLEQTLPLDALDYLSLLDSGCTNLAQGDQIDKFLDPDLTDLSFLADQDLDDFDIQGQYTDYKDYDLQQIPYLAIMRMIDLKSETEKTKKLNAYKKAILAKLSCLAENTSYPYRDDIASICDNIKKIIDADESKVKEM